MFYESLSISHVDKTDLQTKKVFCFLSSINFPLFKKTLSSNNIIRSNCVCFSSRSARSSPLFSDILGMRHYIFISSLKTNAGLWNWRTVNCCRKVCLPLVEVCFCSSHQSHFLADGGARWLLNLLPAHSSYCTHKPPNVSCKKKQKKNSALLHILNMINLLNSILNLTCVSILCR